LNIQEEAHRSLARLRPWLLRLFKDDAAAWPIFEARLDAGFPRLFELLISLYGTHYDFFYHLEALLKTAAHAHLERTPTLRALDVEREGSGARWYQSEKQVAGVCYVDLYATDLAGIRARIPYLKELGLTYLHLMPLFKAPAGNSDGGYAVSSFREVNPALGTMDQLAALAAELRAEGISLALDLVFNHTSDEHEWALRAKAGDKDYQAFYRMFPDRTLPDQYERTLREVFPEQAPGNFTFVPEVGQWVWTTFNTFQWDLNYANPAVFDAMLGEMLFLANRGVQILRLDAVAFVWKEIGTTSENLPQAHWIIEALNILVKLAAPATIFKSEAIVHPDDVAKYIGRECEISYHPTLMVLLWEALATHEVRLLRHTLAKRFVIPENAAWVNYIRLHDDIGWSFANEDAAELGIDGEAHRNFLNAFYTGQFPGSYARGLPFNYNPRTGDMRISGMAASLNGLETALENHDDAQIELSIARYLLIQGLTLAAGGIPLLYLNDELGALNDYSYRNDPAHAGDSRWVHRPRFNAARWAARTDPASIAGRHYLPLLNMIHVRKAHAAFAANGYANWLESGNPYVLAVERSNIGENVLILANFSEHKQVVNGRFSAGEKPLTDLISGAEYPVEQALTLPPYGMLWLLHH